MPMCDLEVPELFLPGGESIVALLLWPIVVLVASFLQCTVLLFSLHARLIRNRMS